MDCFKRPFFTWCALVIGLFLTACSEEKQDDLQALIPKETGLQNVVHHHGADDRQYFSAQPPEEQAAFIQQIAVALRTRDCTTVESLINKHRQAFSLVQGYLYETGTCTERDLPSAVEHYRYTIKYGKGRAQAHARLGALYQLYPELSSDDASTSEHFMWAVAFTLPELERRIRFGPSAEFEETLAHSLWDTSLLDMHRNFTTLAIGPWAAPDQLSDQLLEAEKWREGDGREYINFAKELKAAASSDEDIFLAEEWLQLAELLGNQEAVELREKWLDSPDTCKLRPRFKPCLKYQSE